MNTTMTCEQFEERLPEYMEGELAGDERDALERHAESCAHCRPILEDLKSIVTAAGALGPIEPPRDLWSGIESRIGTRVVSLGTRRSLPAARTLAAAVVLMAVTAGVTWQLAKHGQPGISAPATPQPSTVASSSTDEPSPKGGTGPIIVTTPPQVATTAGAGSAGTTATTTKKSPAEATLGGDPSVRAVANGGRVVSTAALYDHEITRLHSVIEQRRGELDPKTVAAIERSLAVIDTAIAQARSALAADPASRFLHGRLTDALDKKVELLRTTAMLPARS
jgi:putative zinc finger protein